MSDNPLSERLSNCFRDMFPRFLGLPEPARTALFEQHADLFGTDFWRDVQQKLRAGEILEVFPYSPQRRLDY